MRQFFARALLFIGFLCLLFSVTLLYKRYRPNPLAFEKNFFVKSEHSVRSDMPVSLQIPSIGLSLPIVTAQIDGVVWETTDRGVSYLTSSPLPGEIGNSIIYGHNWPNLLGKLPKVKPSDEVIVNFSDERKETFEVAFVTIVTPEQTKILENSSDSRLTIYTCTGFLDSKRFVVTALKSNTSPFPN